MAQPDTGLRATDGLPPPRPVSDLTILHTMVASAWIFAAFGFAVSSPQEILEGLMAIVNERDALITDYIYVGGTGAAFVNAGLLTLLTCAIYHVARAPMTGVAVACLLTVQGFALFGKNVLNVWPIVAGVLLYARLRREPFSTYINTAFFGCALAPVVSEILFSTQIPFFSAVPLAIGTGLLLGFILPPVAAQLFKTHSGFNLYNLGFTAGVIGVLVVAIYKAYGFIPQPVLLWSSTDNLRLGTLLVFLFTAMILGGLVFDRYALKRMLSLMKESGQAPSDFIATAGFGCVLVNMGLCGLIGTAFVLLVNSDLNGPTIGGIFTIVGFAAFGKHPANIVPIMLGILIGTVAKPWNANEPGIVLAALFGTTLAPVAGRFGWYWGIVAGLIHISAAQSVGAFHAGLNLYNNGFAAGMVAAVLVPVIKAIRELPKRGRR